MDTHLPCNPRLELTLELDTLKTMVITRMKVCCFFVSGFFVNNITNLISYYSIFSFKRFCLLNDGKYTYIYIYIHIYIYISSP
jgi:hypothetical protein